MIQSVKKQEQCIIKRMPVGYLGSLQKGILRMEPQTLTKSCLRQRKKKEGLVLRSLFVPHQLGPQTGSV